MPLPLLAALLLSATPKFALAPLNCPGSDASRAEFFTEHLADRLSDQGLDVTSPRETTAVLGLERQRALLGCAESSCLVELAGALGVVAIVVGDVAQLGATFQINLKAVDARSGKRVASFSSTTATPESIVPTLSAGARQLATQLAPVYQLTLSQPTPVEVVTPSPPSPGAARFWWIPAIAVAGGGVLAAIEFSVAEDRRRVLVDAQQLSEAQARSAYQVGVEARTVGWVGVGVASAAACALGALVLFGRDTPATPTVMVAPDRVGLGVGGTF